MSVDFEHIAWFAEDGRILERLDALKAAEEYIRSHDRPEIADHLLTLYQKAAAYKTEIDEQAERIAPLLYAIDKLCDCDWGLDTVDRKFEEWKSAQK